MEEKLHICRATLSNRTETPLQFKLITSEPFFLVELDPVTKKPTAQLVETEFAVLQPKQSALVCIGLSK